MSWYFDPSIVALIRWKLLSLSAKWRFIMTRILEMEPSEQTIDVPGPVLQRAPQPQARIAAVRGAAICGMRMASGWSVDTT